MGKLYDTVRQIDAVIARKNLPVFKTKGLIAIHVGFSLALVEEATPDDEAKVDALRRVAGQVLGEPIP
ncbi:hypothetical protein [Anaeromyxobacter dehalogenans]|uniref:hypothetical protein n=1 Tax=Anaeromyxobacter dehalogenans TaxID=161493 RepID=UPI000051C5AC|nr:hypothetical protein [Anaeromyxobacter dehalogenans]